jgi:hypothetical protein
VEGANNTRRTHFLVIDNDPPVAVSLWARTHGLKPSAVRARLKRMIAAGLAT